MRRRREAAAGVTLNFISLFKVTSLHQLDSTYVADARFIAVIAQMEATTYNTAVKKTPHEIGLK